MRFIRTRSLRLVKKILTDPAIYPHIGDDHAPTPAQFHPNPDKRIWYVVVVAEHRLAGLFMFLPESAVCWEAHVAMLPWAWGKIAHQAGRAIVPWIWEQTECRRIVAHVPRFNRAAILFGFEAMRLTKFGVNEKSFLKHGRMWDQVLMGISRVN